MIGVFFFVLFVFFFITFFLYTVYFFFSLTYDFSVDKLTSYECGFSAFNLELMTFSVHFFSVMLVFIIFDLELVFLVGFLMVSLINFFLFVFVLFFVILSYYYEITFNILIWSN